MARTAEAQHLQAEDDILEEIERRVMWLATLIVHYANRIRPNPDGVKVGGHHASSTSLVSVMTVLWFEFLRAGDRVAVKPHASPVFHAIQYLLGRIDRSYLKALRAFHGLQAYPSRTKDPDNVDFSTGSLGLGAVAPNFAALADRYVCNHFGAQSKSTRRYISLVGDAELDEGSIWEAVADPAFAGLNNILWIVDLNRQSLDRVIPGTRYLTFMRMFAANGWHVIDLKYGIKLQNAFMQHNGEILRERIDQMGNEEYQNLLRVPADTLRKELITGSADPDRMRRLLERWTDQQLLDLFSNLGGHDRHAIRAAFAEANAVLCDRPVVIFAHTIKGWGLPFAGDPLNHSMYLTEWQLNELQSRLGIPSGEEFDRFPPDSPAGRLCAAVAARLYVDPVDVSPSPQTSPSIPTEMGYHYRGQISTQTVLGRILSDIVRTAPELAQRIVTVSPDVAISTNLAGWINRVGVFSTTDRCELAAVDKVRPVRWRQTRLGQHIELGISENNLFLLLGQLGLTRETSGQLLFPIGTLYDPFICRGLDALIYSLYSGARFIVVGTPSGVTLSTEGGAHQSVITPSIGLELPRLVYYEPCFGQELEWILLHALARLAASGLGESFYFRLTTQPVDQSLFPMPNSSEARERLRRQVIAGGYRLIDQRSQPGYHPGVNVVHLFATGAVVPEAIRATEMLRDEGVYANLINVTSADLLYRSQRLESSTNIPDRFVDLVAPDERQVPVVTVIDGHPHTLAWIGSALGVRCLPLGVTDFGQSGSRSDLYNHFRISAEWIAEACLTVLDW